jgi:hypothetical protein
MTRVLLTFVALNALAISSRADEAVVRLNVQPMLAPKPVLKYQLLPELRELNPGNAAHNYLKCFMEQRNFFYSKEAVADRARYLAMPLAELPAKDLYHYGGFALTQADWAARLDTVDWQDLHRIQESGLKELPPEAGPLQLLGTALRVRFRAEVAGRHFGDAVRTAKTMFALARHLGEHPSEVANLVGFWVAHLALNTLEEMLQQPGCPNFYWALTDLPYPLVDLRKGVQGQRTLVAAELRVLRDDAPMTEAELKKFLSRFCSMKNFARVQEGRPLRNPRAGLMARVKDLERVRTARHRLVAAGCAEGLVNQFPPLQVILLDEKLAYEVERDERIKLLALPLWQIDSPANSQESRGEGLFADLLPDIIKLRRTQGELERQIALLRHVEALRLHAAEHGGKLPVKLLDVSVPLPVDPATGKLFGYAVDGVTAHIRGTAPSSPNRSLGDNVHYQVTVPASKPAATAASEPLAGTLSLAKSAEFLDGVTLAWIKGKKCASCHTGFPYLLARPVLGDPNASGILEVRKFLEERVASWDRGGKGTGYLKAEGSLKISEWVTEVVAIAATLAQHDALSTGKLHPRTRQALDRMWELQQKDGSWTWNKTGLAPSEHDDYFGAVYAALGVGAAPEGYAQSEAAKEGLARLRGYLRKNPPPSPHHKTWLLLASLRLDGLMTRTEREQTIKDLLALQGEDGGWNLPSLGDWKSRDGKPNDKQAPSDGYATGLVVYVLRQAGVPPGEEQLQRAVNWLKTNQRASGRWLTRSLNGLSGRSIGNAGTALAVMALKACDVVDK